LLREGPFERLWVQPAAGDAGAAIGCGLFVWHQLLDHPRTVAPGDSLQGAFLGPSYSDPEIVAFLRAIDAPFEQFENDDALCDAVSALLADGSVVGHFAGRMEFGPRALGHRSILADARAATMQATLNEKIKLRETFRPFAPAVLRERVRDYFDVPEDSPYMTIVGDVQPDKRLTDVTQPKGLARLSALRSVIPAVTHVDHSARVQTVDAERNPRFHRILRAFERRTGCPVLVNTSFNVRGEPIVNTPAEAYRCFMSTGMDALVLESCLLLRARQPARHVASARAGID
jgi:carbamoyltransferase